MHLHGCDKRRELANDVMGEQRGVEGRGGEGRGETKGVGRGGRGEEDSPLGTSTMTERIERENCCSVCGRTEAWVTN